MIILTILTLISLCGIAIGLMIFIAKRDAKAYDEAMASAAEAMEKHLLRIEAEREAGEAFDRRWERLP